MLMEPYNRWLEGLRYWLTDWALNDQDKKIWDLKETSPVYFEKFNWPRMGNHTKTITECITGIKVDAFLVVDTNMDAKFWDLCKQYNLNYDLTQKLTHSHQLIYDPKGTAKLALKRRESPEQEAMKSAAGAGFVTQARDTLRRIGIPQLPDKERAIRVSAKQ